MSFLGFLVYCAVVLPPLWMLAPRFGLSPWWALAGIVPIGVVGLLWYMALRPSAGGTGA